MSIEFDRVAIKKRTEKCFAALYDAKAPFGNILEPGRNIELIEKLPDFFELLLTWNRTHDLTAPRTLDELVDLYLPDALILAQYIEGPEFCDVGIGGGAPGLPIAWLRPDLNHSWIEPRLKRVAFLRTAAGKFLGKMPHIHRNGSDDHSDANFDEVVARATLPPPEWLHEGARLSRKAVWVLLAKEAVPELAGWHVEHEIDYVWPCTQVTRKALKFVPIPSDR